jgi:hypothetical protein
MNNSLDFSGKVALVTGAAAGMGLATAQAFAEAGASEQSRHRILHRFQARSGRSDADGRARILLWLSAVRPQRTLLLVITYSRQAVPGLLGEQTPFPARGRGRGWN